mmetsp:Transcript_19931/g.29659  ORF Transcript_19931/g.29659 Transcript_19931/m.29659 type:complete len:130 (-) Transcript_19931:485-874(-)
MEHKEIIYRRQPPPHNHFVMQRQASHNLICCIAVYHGYGLQDHNRLCRGIVLRGIETPSRLRICTHAAVNGSQYLLLSIPCMHHVIGVAEIKMVYKPHYCSSEVQEEPFDSSLLLLLPPLRIQQQATRL